MAEETIQQCMRRWHGKVPFPLTVRKIKKYGYVPDVYLLGLLSDLGDCSDKSTKLHDELIKAINELQGLLHT